MTIRTKDEEEEEEEEEKSQDSEEQYRRGRENKEKLNHEENLHHEENTDHKDPEKNIHRTSREDCINRISKGNILNKKIRHFLYLFIKKSRADCAGLISNVVKSKTEQNKTLNIYRPLSQERLKGLFLLYI